MDDQDRFTTYGKLYALGYRWVENTGNEMVFTKTNVILDNMDMRDMEQEFDVYHIQDSDFVE